jgi:hypothetical protein
LQVLRLQRLQVLIQPGQYGVPLAVSATLEAFRRFSTGPTQHAVPAQLVIHAIEQIP